MMEAFFVPRFMAGLISVNFRSNLFGSPRPLKIPPLLSVKSVISGSDSTQKGFQLAHLAPKTGRTLNRPYIFFTCVNAQYDWTTGALDNGNEWRKFRAGPRLYPLRSLVCTLFNRGGSRRAFRLPGARGGKSFPLRGGTFARSYSVPIVGPLFFFHFLEEIRPVLEIFCVPLLSCASQCMGKKKGRFGIFFVVCFLALGGHCLQILSLPGFGTHTNTQNLRHLRAVPASMRELSSPRGHWQFKQLKVSRVSNDAVRGGGGKKEGGEPPEAPLPPPKKIGAPFVWYIFHSLACLLENPDSADQRLVWRVRNFLEGAFSGTFSFPHTGEIVRNMYLHSFELGLTGLRIAMVERVFYNIYISPKKFIVPQGDGDQSSPLKIIGFLLPLHVVVVDRFQFPAIRSAAAPLYLGVP